MFRFFYKKLCFFLQNFKKKYPVIQQFWGNISYFHCRLEQMVMCKNIYYKHLLMEQPFFDIAVLRSIQEQLRNESSEYLVFGSLTLF